MARLIVPVILVFTLIAGLAACGGEDPTTTASTALVPGPTGTQIPPTAAPGPTTTAAPQPTAVLPTTAPEPTPTAAPAPSEASATATPALQPTESPAMSQAEKLAAYAAEHANGPGAIFVGDPTQLIGRPPHERLMFQFPAEQYNLLAGAALVGSPELQVPSHLFIYSSDYYQGLIQKAKLTNPTELVSSGESIEIQHVCLDRNLPPCVLIQAYYAPNLARRINGQVQISVVSLVELQIGGPDTLTQVSDGTLDMVNIFTGYVAGELPALEVQSLWESAPDWETSYTTLTLLAEDIDRIMREATGGSHVLNRNWFAGSDHMVLQQAATQQRGGFQGAEDSHQLFVDVRFHRRHGRRADLQVHRRAVTSLDQGVVDSAVYGALLAVSARLHDITDFMVGPVIGFGYTNNVINKDVWNEIPEDLQQIMIEEGAKAELEGLRLAPFQNVAAVAINQQLGTQPVPFSAEIQEHIQTVVLPEYVIPGWLRRLGYPENNADIVAVFNEKLSPHIGIWINEDGSVEQVPITKGSRATQ